MDSFKSILVDVDALANAHPSLERAVQLALATGASLTIVDVVTFPPHARRHVPAELEEAMAQTRRDRLAVLAAATTGVRAATKLLAGRPATALIEEVLRSGHDLLVRSHARDRAAPEARTFGPVDMELLRMCPCPVLLVRHGTPAPRPRVAGAVNASADDADEAALNGKIANMTLQMAALLDARTVTLLHAWAPFAESSVRRHSSDGDLAAYVEGARQEAEAGMASLVRSLQAPAALQTALPRGDAVDVIPQFVVSEGIDVLVMGAVGRGGIRGMIIGNTAERILSRIPCSVLAVKPDGFLTPVRLPIE